MLGAVLTLALIGGGAVTAAKTPPDAAPPDAATGGVPSVPSAEAAPSQHAQEHAPTNIGYVHPG
jgi:hypothetical protein